MVEIHFKLFGQAKNDQFWLKFDEINFDQKGQTSVILRAK